MAAQELILGSIVLRRQKPEKDPVHSSLEFEKNIGLVIIFV
jgi:hypothetical protein